MDPEPLARGRQRHRPALAPREQDLTGGLLQLRDLGADRRLHPAKPLARPGKAQRFGRDQDAAQVIHLHHEITTGDLYDRSVFRIY